MPTQEVYPEGSPRFPEEDEIDLADLLFVLWRKRNIILMTILVFVVIGVAAALLIPRTYEAKTSLLILPPIPFEITGTEKDSLLAPNIYFLAPDIYIDLAVAEDLMEEVITTLYPEGEDRPTARSLAGNLKVSVNKSSEAKNTPSSQSLTLKVSLKGSEPKEISKILEAWSKAFIKRNSQLFINRIAQSYEYLKETFSSVSKDLVTAEDALSTYRKENPTSVLSMQLEIMKNLHGEFLSQYTKSVRSLPPLEARAEAVREQLSKEPDTKILTRGMTKDALWQFLSQNLKPEEIGSLGELTVEDEILNPRHETLKAKLYELDAEIISLKTSIADLRQHIEKTEKEYNEKQTKLLEITLDTERLSRQEKVLKDSYTAMAQKFQASRIAVAEAADPIRVIERPVVPQTPVAPRRTLIVALSGVLGLFFGLFAALMTNMVQNRRPPTIS